MKKRKGGEGEVRLKAVRPSRIPHETKRSVGAVLLIGVAAILLLARWGKAGPVGNALFGALDALFGWGYYLVPAITLMIGLLFLLTHAQKSFGVTAIGGAFFILAGLGLIDLILPERGGWLGKAVGTLERPFGKPAAIVLATTLLVAAFLITFNASINLRAIFKRKGAETDASPENLDTLSESEARVPPSLPDTGENNERTEPKEKKGGRDDVKPVIVDSGNEPPKMNRHAALVKAKDYVAPPLNLLKSAAEKPTSGDLRANANIIKRTLEGFGIPVEMGEINIGPKVTRYTLKPAEGVKLTRITALNQDLSLALAAHPIRIEAPIPGKSLVGIEVPNKAAAIVRLGSLMGYPEFMNSGPLSFILGRDVSGEPIFTDVEKMPHLLVAGSTGSGKSVMIHALLVSLLYKNSPATLRLILIDPKRVELSIYKDIPHLIAPVIVESKKTIGVFRWAIHEMERRYELLLEGGARDVKSYNAKNGDEPLPYLLIVIDELADLMASYGKEVEGSVVRLAQMARATGIHLIVSTQRPSVEVITGLIKANITARIALQVASQVDSRTILDMAGAEKLLGGGDLLFMSSEFPKPKRIQGAYLTEEEIKKVTDFIRDNNDIVSEALAPLESTADQLAFEGRPVSAIDFDSFAGGDDEDDELLEEAVGVVREAKKASASLLQRRLKVGYARAARLLDIMEAKGIVGPGEGAKPREIFE